MRHRTFRTWRRSKDWTWIPYYDDWGTGFLMLLLLISIGIYIAALVTVG